MFLALELMSIALYGLAGFDRSRRESQEAALKYFLIGSFASGFLLYGIALVYGATGSTSIERVTRALGVMGPQALPLAVLGTAMLLVGLRLQGRERARSTCGRPTSTKARPTTVTAFMAAGVKAAAFAALLRVFDGGLCSLASHWQPLLAVLAILTMPVGNLAALAQTNLKRMLAYSSIAHAGYLLTALVARPALASEAVLFYLVAYAAMNLGAFGVIAALARDGREPSTVADLAGLAERRPALAAALTVFLVSLTGIPVTAGFVGKFNLFAAAISAGRIGIVLAIVGMLTSVVSAYYYLRVVVAMYMEPPLGEDNFAAVPAAAVLALVLSAGVTLLFGLWPTPVLTLARLASRGLF